MSRLTVGTVLALALAAACAAGCTPEASGNPESPLLPKITDYASFQRKVLQSDRPVLMEFNKNPCPTCVVQVKEIEQLYPEYSDRVTFYSMGIMEGFFHVTQPEVRDQYHIGWVPTTILFANGKEVKRWELNHTAFEIRQTLRELYGPPAAGGSMPTGPGPGKYSTPPAPPRTGAGGM